MPLQIRLTRSQLEDLLRVVNVGSSSLRSLRSRLGESAQPILNHKELLAFASSQMGKDAEPVIRQLLAISGLVRRTGYSVEDVIGGFEAAIRTQRQDPIVTADAWNEVATEFRALLAEQSVRLAATALELAYDYANLLRRTKVLTDIRPLFSEDAASIEGAVVSYTLRLHYSSANTDHELSIALDEDDLNELIKQCTRAIAKAETSKTMLVDKCQIVVAKSGDAKND
jgi:hypothetical protein